jgi:hypothetical protein
MVEDDEEASDGGSPSPALQGGAVGRAKGLRDLGPKVAFQIIPAAQAVPPQTDAVRRIAAAVLGLLLVVSSLQLALASQYCRVCWQYKWLMRRDTASQLPSVESSSAHPSSYLTARLGPLGPSPPSLLWSRTGRLCGMLRPQDLWLASYPP